MKLLLVEDDIMIGESLQKAMRSHGVYWATDAFQAEDSLNRESYDTILLDLGLPKKNGLLFLQQLRESGNHTPVIIITAKDSIEDRVKGLDAGADDYLLKPFSIAELEARLRAITRRKIEKQSNQIQVNDATLDAASYTLSTSANSHRLSNKEFAIMHTLMTNPGMIFSKSQLEERLYGWGDEVESNAIEVHVHHIRKKFSQNIIKTIRGIGYTFPETPSP